MTEAVEKRTQDKSSDKQSQSLVVCLLLLLNVGLLIVDRIFSELCDQ